MASRASSKLLRVLKTEAADFESEFKQLCCRIREESESSEEVDVAGVVEKIRVAGDKELRACLKASDGLTLKQLEVTREEWDEACDAVDPADRAALGKAAMRVREFHRKRIPSSWEMREEGGAYMGQRVRPLQRVGIYSGGQAVDISTIIMSAVPASVVEVPEIVLAAQPDKSGKVRAEILMAARVAGIHRVFKMGGAHSIATLAYGTETVPRVDKIVGGGGPEIEAAKRLVAEQAAVDPQVRPTEMCIVADRSATPAWLAADLISKAERHEFANVVFVTHLKTMATRLQDQLTRQLKTIDRVDVAKQAFSTRGALILTRNLEESIRIANDYAPEHLVLAVEGPELQMKQVLNAGAVFLGHYTPVAVGDYLAGPNHVLPSFGTARFGSPLGVEDFLKRMTFVKFEAPKLRELGSDAIRLAEVEGMTASGKAVDLRLQKIRRARREREAAREMEMEI